MAKELVKFKRGKAGLLPEARDPGSLLVEEDTGSVMLDIGENEADRITLKDNTKVPLERKVNGRSLESDIDLTPDDIGADATGTAASKVSSHDQNEAAHPRILNQISSLSSSLSGYVPTSRTINNKKLTGNISLTYSDVGADKAGTAQTEVSTHNTDDVAHNDIRILISDLSTKVTNFLDTDDATADQLSELIALIRDNASDIERITNGKVNVSDVVDNLTTSLANKPLSAKQGVVLNNLVIALQSALSDHSSNTDIHVTASDKAKWDAASEAGSGYVKKSGDTMTGPLTLQSKADNEDVALLFSCVPTIGGRANKIYSSPLQMWVEIENPGSGFVEQFFLPQHSNGDVDQAYQILTSKSPVTILQGGTGANNAKEALQNLGVRVKLMPEDKDANSCTELGVYFFPYPTSGGYNNIPTDNLMSCAGFLIVMPYGSYIAQLWFSIGGAGMDFGLTHTRIALPSGSTWVWMGWHQTNNHKHTLSDITDSPITESGECDLWWSIDAVPTSTRCKYTRHGRSVTVWGQFPTLPDFESTKRGSNKLSGLPWPGTLPQGPVGFCTQMTSDSDAKITSLHLGGGGTYVYTSVEFESGTTQGTPGFRNMPGDIQFTYIVD